MSGISRLKSLIFPTDSSLQIIGKSAFYSTPFPLNTLPSSVRFINDCDSGRATFNNFDYPGREFRFNEGILSLGNNLFMYVGVTKIYLPSSITNLSKGTFYCVGGSLREFIAEGESSAFSVYNKCLYNHDMTQLYNVPPSLEGELLFPSQITTLTHACFLYSKIKEIVIPETVKSIDWQVFWYCYYLRKVTWPTNHLEISHRFYNCPMLSELCIGHSTIRDLAMPDFPIVSIIIRNTTTYIADNAFKSISHLRTITIPSSVVSIGFDAFNGLSQLRRIIILGNPSITNTSFSNTNPSCVICDSSLHEALIENGIHKISFSNCFIPKTCEHLYFGHHFNAFIFVFIVLII